MTHPDVIASTKAFAAGDFKRARQLADRINTADLSENERRELARIQRGLKLDPVFIILAVVMAVVWLVLAWQVTH